MVSPSRNDNNSSSSSSRIGVRRFSLVVVAARASAEYCVSGVTRIAGMKPAWLLPRPTGGGI
eukprot:10580518-Heterocapsa_arctica.AAC.1